MSETVKIDPMPRGGTVALFDGDGNRIGAYNPDTGRGMFADGFFKRVRTCRFEPNVVAAKLDADGNETGEEEPHENCDCFTCSNCGGEMMYGYPDGWFDVEPPYLPHFKYCPHCGAEVVEYRGGEC